MQLVQGWEVGVWLLRTFRPQKEWAPTKADKVLSLAVKVVVVGLQSTYCRVDLGRGAAWLGLRRTECLPYQGSFQSIPLERMQRFLGH